MLFCNILSFLLLRLLIPLLLTPVTCQWGISCEGHLARCHLHLISTFWEQPFLAWLIFMDMSHIVKKYNNINGLTWAPAVWRKVNEFLAFLCCLATEMCQMAVLLKKMCRWLREWFKLIPSWQGWLSCQVRDGNVLLPSSSPPPSPLLLIASEIFNCKKQRNTGQILAA